MSTPGGARWHGFTARPAAAGLVHLFERQFFMCKMGGSFLGTCVEADMLHIVTAIVAVAVIVLTIISKATMKTEV